MESTISTLAIIQLLIVVINVIIFKYDYSISIGVNIIVLVLAASILAVIIFMYLLQTDITKWTIMIHLICQPIIIVLQFFHIKLNLLLIRGKYEKRKETGANSFRLFGRNKRFKRKNY